MKRLRSQVKSSVKTEVVETNNFSMVDNHRHSLGSENEITSLRIKLLNWYDINKRGLQWRDLAKHSDPNVRGYSGIYFLISVLQYVFKLFALFGYTANLQIC